ncbi:hypothetical protein BGY98DRAFT_280070 [Russula aff. rugulosa BPL654]|nr:hypothetical protein BGY98DRAFT_280070 [Russula aff. rugulosa BPL654]
MGIACSRPATVEFTDDQHQFICQDTGQSTNLTINDLPGEVLLEIFVSYRQGIYPYQYQCLWRKRYVWFNLAHVCRKWRAVMFASPSRLDLGITVGYKRPSGVRTILSGPLPIFVVYSGVHGITDLPGYEYRNMRTAFERHRDRVREISFKGSSADFDKFFEVTKCPFPVLESLVLNVNNVASELKPLIPF